MIKKKIVLADEDERYLKEIRYEFMEKVSKLELITFTKREMLYQYLEQGGEADILVVDESLVGGDLDQVPMPAARIALSSSMSPIDGFEVVKKYQRMESLINAILLKYAQESGSLEVVRGDSHTRLAAFYSPAGGTGKTTLALAMAAAAARKGLRTLYLNLEEIDSVQDVLGRTTNCLSDIFLALKTRGMQVGIKLQESIQMEPSAGFYYVSGVESISEYEEIDGEDMKKLLEAVRELSSYDLVILDQASGFAEKTAQILSEADVIFVPVVQGEGSISKLQRFLNETSLHGRYDPLFDKMSLILNQADPSDLGLTWLPDVIRSRIPCCAGIAALPLLRKRRDILLAGNTLLPIMSPMLLLSAAERGDQGR